MSPQLERNLHLTQEQAILADVFLHFYQKNNELFSAQDKIDAKNYFQGIGENLTAERLLERQRKCVEMCEHSINFALQQRKEFFNLLRSLPIAFDRKDKLRIQFLNGDFQIKTQLVDFLHQEEKRIALKREAQREVIEAHKNQFITFYEAHASYFNETDRELAINYVITSIQSFRTHAGKLGRLQMLLTMLPANLAYARELDGSYQNLLRDKVILENERESMLLTFRNSNFAHKNELLKRLSELVIVVPEKKAESKTDESTRLLEQYKDLCSQSTEGTTGDRFLKLSPAEQKKLIEGKQDEIKKLALAQVGESKEQQESVNLKKIPETTVQPGSTNTICTIAIRILQNKHGKKYNNDKEIVEDIEREMKQDNISGSFSEDNLRAMRSILPRLPEQYWGTTLAAAWLKKELQGITVVHEYTN